MASLGAIVLLQAILFLPDTYALISEEPEDFYLVVGWGILFAILCALWLRLGIRYVRGAGLGVGSLRWLARLVFSVVFVVFTIIAVTQPIDRVFSVGLAILAWVSLMGVLFVPSSRESSI